MTVRNSSEIAYPEHAADASPEEAADALTSTLSDIIPGLTWRADVRHVPGLQGYGIPMARGYVEDEHPSPDTSIWCVQFMFMGIDPYAHKRDTNSPELRFGPVPDDQPRRNHKPVVDWSWFDSVSFAPGTTAPGDDALKEAAAKVSERLSGSVREARESLGVLETFEKELLDSRFE